METQESHKTTEKVKNCKFKDQITKYLIEGRNYDYDCGDLKCTMWLCHVLCGWMDCPSAGCWLHDNHQFARSVPHQIEFATNDLIHNNSPAKCSTLVSGLLLMLCVRNNIY